MTGAGWYPDPAGRHEHRYHDGVAWTDHVADDGVAGIAPMPPTPGPPPPWAPPPAWGPPPGWGAPGWGGAVALEHPEGTTVLVLGILSLLVCGVLGPIAWVKCNKALADMDRRGGTWANRGQVQAGRICGIVSSVMLIVSVGFLLLVVLAAIASNAAIR